MANTLWMKSLNYLKLKLLSNVSALTARICDYIMIEMELDINVV